MLEKKDQSEVLQFAVYSLTHTNVVLGETDKREGVASLSFLATTLQGRRQRKFLFTAYMTRIESLPGKVCVPFFNFVEQLCLCNDKFYFLPKLLTHSYLFSSDQKMSLHMHNLIFRITYILNIPSLSSALCDGD